MGKLDCKVKIFILILAQGILACKETVSSGHDLQTGGLQDMLQSIQNESGGDVTAVVYGLQIELLKKQKLTAGIKIMRFHT